jgi:putative SOS response-associated peptidase YedK
MCVSAKLDAELRELEREYEATMGWIEFEEIFERRLKEDIKVLKTIELQIEQSSAPQANKIRKLILEYRAMKSAELEQEIFKQKKRLADAERLLKSKPTKKAAEEQRIATNLIDAGRRRLIDVKRTEPEERDSRIYPFYFAPIVINESKQKKIIPARYHCRPNGKPAILDRKLPGLYNARRSSLEDFWKDLFGHHHAIMRINSFYENIALHKVEHRELRPGEKEKNTVLHFNPKPTRQMNIACVWSHWRSQGDKDLRSFAAITDIPNSFVAAAGHDRTIIMLAKHNVDAWLTPAGHSLSDFYRMFDEQERPVFEYQQAA